MTEVRYTDYAWISDDSRLFDEGFCLTIFSAASVDDVLAVLPPVATSSRGDYQDLTDLAYDHGFDMVGGLLQVDDAVILYEPYGYLDDDVKQSLSVGRTVVSIDGNPAVSYFQFFRDGSRVTAFEKMFADTRDGDEPDELLPLMEQIGGFDLTREPDEELPEFPTYESASYALGEAVTGVQLTHSLLTQSRYLVCHFARTEH